MSVASSRNLCPAHADQPRSLLLGIIFYILYQACLTADTTIVFDLGHSMTLSQLTFVRGFGCLLVLVFISGRQLPHSFKTGLLRLTLARSLLTLLAIWLIYYGIQHLSLSDALVIIYLRPLFVVAMGVLFLREKLTFRKALAVLIGFVGTVLAVGPSLMSRDRIYLSAAIVATLGALVGAAATVTTKALTQSNTNETILAYMSVVFFSASPFATVQAWPCARWLELTLLALSGGMAVWFSTQALRHADASILGPFEYFRLPLGLGLAFVCFSEQPSTWTILGSTLIVISCLPLLPIWPSRSSSGRFRANFPSVLAQ